MSGGFKPWILPNQAQTDLTVDNKEWNNKPTVQTLV